MSVFAAAVELAWRAILVVPRLLLRLGDLLVALARVPFSGTWFVEAVCFSSVRESHTWETTRAERRRVVADVRDALGRGDDAKGVAGATYVGWRRSAM
jgi:hypothetical protein